MRKLSALIPSYDQLFIPTLNALITLDGAGTIKAIYQEVAKQLDLDEHVLSVRHGKSGQTEVEYRLAWSRTYLGQYGLIKNTSRGVWELAKEIDIAAISPKDIVEHVRSLHKGIRTNTIEPQVIGGATLNIFSTERQLVNTPKKQPRRPSTMNLRQQIIWDRVERVGSQIGVERDAAFARFSHSVITGQSIYAFDEADYVDGSQEKQIDIITIEQDDLEATVYIMQTKATGGFSSNTVIQIRNGLEWIFTKTSSDISKLTNLKFQNKISEVRSLWNAIGTSNIRIVVAFVTNGLTSDIRDDDEINQEIKTIRDRFDNDTFSSFEFKLWGADELVDRLNMEERNERKINADIIIKYDTNNPSLIKYHCDDFMGVICTTEATEIARIVNEDKVGAVFDSNIRRFLGTRGGVNSDILGTCTKAELGSEFWFLNNGITIVCDDCDPVTNPDNPHLKIRNLQIVNGCQTATTLALAQRAGKLSKDVRVLLRVYKTGDSDIVNRIVLTTNNQNKISSRDLRANDPIQLDMERGFHQYGLFYERKPRQYDSDSKASASKIIPNETVAQAYLAVVLRKPSDARRRKYKVWGEMYENVFQGSAIEPYIIATLVTRHVDKWLKSSSYAASRDDVTRKLANNGTYHVARAVVHLWQGSKWTDVNDLASRTELLTKGAGAIEGLFDNAFAALKAAILSDSKFSSDIDNALKSSTLDSELEKILSKGIPKNPLLSE